MTSLVSFIGPKPNLLGIDEMNPPLRLEVSQPVLDFFEMEKIRHIERYTQRQVPGRSSSTSPTRSPGASEAIEARLASLARAGRGRGARGLLDHHHLRPQGGPRARRDSGAARAFRDPPAPGRQGPAHLAPAWWSRPARRARCTTSRCSAATAPRRCIPTSRSRRCSSSRRRASSARRRRQKAIKNYVKAIGKGLKKVMSKMGISTYMSYTGAQIFEAVGLSRIAGRQVLHRHRLQRRRHRPVRSRRRGDPHPPRRVRRARPGAAGACSTPAANTPGACAARSTCGRPDAIAKLQHATRNKSYSTYKEYAAAHQRPVARAT